MNIENLQDTMRTIVESHFGNAESTRGVKYMIEDWERNKSHLLSYLGEKGMVATESFTMKDDLPVALVETSKSDFVFWLRITLRSEGYIIIASELTSYLNSHITVRDFETNTVSKKYESEKVKVPAGMKLTRTFKLFMEIDEGEKSEKERLLREIQDRYSTYRQHFTASGEGRIVLSAHPLDYATISDNNHRWSSCHTLEGGDYRGGNFNFMVDEVTLVAYFISDDFDEKLDVLPNNLEWNSKKWRTLIHLKQIEEDEWVVIYNKSYPYQDRRMMERVDKLVCETFNIDTTLSTFEDRDYWETTEEIRPSQLIDTHHNFLGYLDLYHSGESYMRLPEEWLLSERRAVMTIGETIYCVSCGREEANDPYDMTCMWCSEVWECENCYGEYPEEEMIFLHGSHCYDCYSEIFTTCSVCYYDYPSDDMEFIQTEDDYVCPECLKKKRNELRTLSIFYNQTGTFYEEGLLTEDEVEDIVDNKFYPVLREKSDHKLFTAMVAEAPIRDEDKIYGQSINYTIRKLSFHADLVARTEGSDSYLKRIELINEDEITFKSVELFGYFKTEEERDRVVSELRETLEGLINFIGKSIDTTGTTIL